MFFHGPGEPDLRAVLECLVGLYPGIWASHLTAALLHEFWLPPRFRRPGDLHISRARKQPQVKLSGLVCHRPLVLDGEVSTLQGIPVSTPARTWLDLAGTLEHDALVVLGDQLVRLPRWGRELQFERWSTPGQMAELLTAHPNVPGTARARAALKDVRVGSDSPPETMLRLALVRSGLPEPELQVRLNPADRNSPEADLGYRRYRIAIQYDGEHHRTPAQQASDNRRDGYFDRARWRYFKLGREDLRTSFTRACQLIREAIVEAQGDAVPGLNA
ncbi:hypothetical protein [Zafaria cholistanensis]|uniref:hypothetical protein n=1 Tax=Zafaria cholistanensis TaxID=1682741 RepID=UPI00123068C5|nr:hypothetical protein [Zafaria cholistanensis]